MNKYREQCLPVPPAAAPSAEDAKLVLSFINDVMDEFDNGYGDEYISGRPEVNVLSSIVSNKLKAPLKDDIIINWRYNKTYDQVETLLDNILKIIKKNSEFKSFIKNLINFCKNEKMIKKKDESTPTGCVYRFYRALLAVYRKIHNSSKILGTLNNPTNFIKKYINTECIPVEHLSNNNIANTKKQYWSMSQDIPQHINNMLTECNKLISYITENPTNLNTKSEQISVIKLLETITALIRRLPKDEKEKYMKLYIKTKTAAIEAFKAAKAAPASGGSKKTRTVTIKSNAMPKTVKGLQTKKKLLKKKIKKAEKKVKLSKDRIIRLK